MPSRGQEASCNKRSGGWEPVGGGGASLAAAACSRRRRRTSRRQLARQGSGGRGTIRENWWFQNGLDDCDDGNDSYRDGDWIDCFFIITNEQQAPWPWPQLFYFMMIFANRIWHDSVFSFNFSVFQEWMHAAVIQPVTVMGLVHSHKVKHFKKSFLV